MIGVLISEDNKKIEEKIEELTIYFNWVVQRDIVCINIETWRSHGPESIFPSQIKNYLFPVGLVAHESHFTPKAIYSHR